MKSSVRRTDFVVRLGGDEFLIILPKTPELMADRIAAKIKNKFAQEQINVFCDSISLGTSIKIRWTRISGRLSPRRTRKCTPKNSQLGGAAPAI